MRSILTTVVSTTTHLEIQHGRNRFPHRFGHFHLVRYPPHCRAYPAFQNPGDMVLLKEALQKLQPQNEKTKPWLAHSAPISFPELAPSSPSPPLVPETQAKPSYSLEAGSVQSHPVGGLEGDNLEGDIKENPKAEALQTVLDQPIATADQSFAATRTKTPPPIQNQKTLQIGSHPVSKRPPKKPCKNR